jgi:hypothetical protein
LRTRLLGAEAPPGWLRALNTASRQTGESEPGGRCGRGGGSGGPLSFAPGRAARSPAPCPPCAAPAPSGCSWLRPPATCCDPPGVASPSELLASPSELSASPSELLVSPSELLASPRKLTSSSPCSLARLRAYSATAASCCAISCERSASTSRCRAATSLRAAATSCSASASLCRCIAPTCVPGTIGKRLTCVRGLGEPSLSRPCGVAMLCCPLPALLESQARHLQRFANLMARRSDGVKRQRK